MRAALATIVALLPLMASAATYSLTDQAGDVQCILYDGHASYTPPSRWTLSGAPVPNCSPSLVDTPPNPTVISGSAFWARFQSSEQAAISTAAQSNAAVMTWLITALAASGGIDLTNTQTKAGLDALVAAGLLTSARETAILTP